MPKSAEGKDSRVKDPKRNRTPFARRRAGAYSMILRYAVEIAHSNLATLKVASIAGIAIMSAMLVQRFVMSSVLTYSIVPFVIGILVMGAMLAVAGRNWPDHRAVAASIAGTAAFAACWYTIVFFFDAVMQPEKQCVLTCVAFVVMPALFNSRPAAKIVSTGMALACFIALELALVSPAVVTSDIANTTLAAIIGVGIGVHKSAVSEGRIMLLDMYHASTKTSIWVSQQNLTDGSFMLLRVPESLSGEIAEGLNGKETLHALGSVIDPDYREGFEEFIDPATMAERLEEAGGCLSHIFRGSDHRWLKITAVESARSKGRIVSVTFIADDVDETIRTQLAYQQQLEDAVLEAQRANAAKTSFLRRMSHDVRTPINGIRGLLYIAEQSPQDAEVQADCRKKIRSASDYLLTLSNDILDISKLESGTTQLEHVPFDIAQLLASVDDVSGTLAGERGLAFNIKTSADLLQNKRVIGSPKHLQHVLTNLFGNSVKYTPAGGSITVECRQVSCEGDIATYEFTCTDTGIGMSKEFQRRMFEPFAREDRPETESIHGTGLGLAIVHELVEQMGGSLSCESELGHGTSFHVRIPFELDRTTAEEVQAPDLPDIDVSGKRALLVEDNELNREIACFVLEQEGLLVDWAENGKVAVERFKDSKPGTYDIVLMDVMMPVMNGLDAARAIRSLDREDARRVPIVAMTANAFQDDIQQSQDAGMNEHLAKPIEPEKIHQAIQRLLR